MTKVIKWAKGKVHVYSDSVLRLGKMNEHPEENVKWNDQLQDFRQSNTNRELFGVDGEPIEFEWNLFRGFTSWQILQKIQEFLGARQTSPEEFEHRLIFMSMFNDIDGQRKKCLKNVFRIPKKSRISQKNKVSAWTLVIPRIQKRHVERTSTNLKDSAVEYVSV